MLTCLAKSLPCCAVKIRRTIVLSRARTDLQRAEQAQVDSLPILRVVQNALQTDFRHAVCARI